ncbi:unnamed protein product [Periconia digitata]|uniref:DUF7730 domain-containing protein n=1 Tax=Periconia digitata TaxID=1303443 RepID=A0A9W4UCR3_9PLEO|nr:unnamed protein product [Periconia digitata]
MGLLVSCRQAYAEGIESLYSQHVITTQSEKLLLDFPRLVPTFHLANITRLGIVVYAHWDEKLDASVLNLNHLQPILDNLSTHFHRLRDFNLSFIGTRDRHNPGCEFLQGPALPMLDAFHSSKRLRSMRVELPSDAWRTFTEPMQPPDDEGDESWLWPRHGLLWRCLDTKEPTVQLRSYESYERYPRAPTYGDKGKESKGYWLTNGDEGY